MNYDSVLVVNPPSPPGYTSNKDSMGGFGQLYPIGAPYFPPVDMAYLIGFLEAKEHNVQVFECLGYEWDRDKLVNEIKKVTNPSLIVMRTSDPTIKHDIEVGLEIKKSCPQHTLALYGPVVEHRGTLAKNGEGFSILILGEANEPIHELMSGTEMEKVSNLEYVDASGTWRTTQRTSFESDLDRFAFPAWERMPHDAYKIPKSSNMGKIKFLPMVASRGCPYGCNYCPYPVSQGLKWRFRSPGNVVDEIEHLVKDLGVNYILFRDPVFSLNQKWVIEICDEIISRKLNVLWKCETRFDCLKPETLESMSRAGCTGINFGVESSDPEIQLKSGRKPIPAKEIIEKLTICKTLGIKTFCFFIIGLRGDTASSILKTIYLAVTIRADWIQFTAASPLTGTKLREWAISEGYISDQSEEYINTHSVVMGNENLSAKDLNRFLWFAKFIQNNILNRRGVFKDGSNKNMVYQGIKKIADAVSYSFGILIFKVGELVFSFTYKSSDAKE